MAGFDNDIVYAKNADFTGSTTVVESNGLVLDKQIWVGSTSVNAGGTHINVLTLTAAAGVTLTQAPTTLTIGLTGGSAAIERIVPNSGINVVPNGSGSVSIVGTGSITTVGTLNTETIQLTGLTANSVLYGLGTATIGLVASGTTGQVLQTNTGAAPTYSTATYPSTTTVSQILYSSSTNVVSGLATANRAVLTTGATGIPVLTALSIDGQLIIGSTAGVPSASTLTAGTGISITNASNSITIAVTGSGFTWTDVTTATQALSVENGYLTDRGAGVVYTLPASASIGDEIIIVGKLGLTTITPNANQQILMSSASGTVGVTGTAVGTNVGDSITLICTTSGASTIYRAASWVGNWTLN